MESISRILADVDELIVGVGSAQMNYTLDNPFTVGERVEMIRLALREAGIDPGRVFVVPIPDIHSHLAWVSHVVSYVPRFDVVYTNNPTVALPFRDAGYEVRVLPLVKREVYSSTNVRRRMVKGERWEDLVPPSVAAFIRRIRGEERVRDIARGLLGQRA